MADTIMQPPGVGGISNTPSPVSVQGFGDRTPGASFSPESYITQGSSPGPSQLTGPQRAAIAYLQTGIEMLDAAAEEAPEIAQAVVQTKQFLGAALQGQAQATQGGQPGIPPGGQSTSQEIARPPSSGLAPPAPPQPGEEELGF